MKLGLDNRTLLAYGLIGLGAILLLSRLGGGDWLWLMLLAAAFFAGYLSRKKYGFLVAGGVLGGIALGSLVDTPSGMLFGMAIGFFVINQVEPKPNRWALYTAGILGLLGAITLLSSLAMFSAVTVAVLLIGAGGYLLYREKGGSGSSQVAQTPTSSASQAAQAPAAQTVPPPPGEHPSSAPLYTEPPASAPQGVPETTLSATPAPPATDTPLIEQQQARQDASEKMELSPEAQARLSMLERWRRETASAEGTPAYIIFPNSTLMMIASENPGTLEALGTLKGVGPVKLERYGEQVLALLKAQGSAKEVN